MKPRTIKLAGLALAAVAIPSALFALSQGTQVGADPRVPMAQTVMIKPGSFAHMQPGEFLQDSRPAAAPRVPVRIRRPLEIMKFQVGLNDYARCVAEGACKPADARGGDGVPVTGVSYRDALAYARWYSEATGENWRLPTDEEWAFAAGSRFRGDIEPLEVDTANPARGWLSSYQREVDLARRPNPAPKPAGSFGVNEKGVADLAGNIWEWTSSCYVRVTLAADGKRAESAVENCGVRVVQGFHRTYMSNFIRDGKSGGCAVGLPPDNLGFRLVRENSLGTRVAKWFLGGRVAS